MNARTLHFANAEGHQLAARLDLPADEEPLAFALFAHCFTCSKDLRVVPTISRALTQQGFGVLRFDFTGLGESEGDFVETNFSSNLSDLHVAATFLEKNYQAPRLLVGHSLGGAAVLHVAAEMPSVQAVATIGAPFDPSHAKHLFADALDEIEAEGHARVDIGGRPFCIGRSFIDDLRRHDAADVIGSLQRPLLVLHSPTDQTVGIENARLIFDAARHPKSFVTLDDADHLLTDVADAQYVATVLAAWAERYLHLEAATVKHPEPSDNVITATLGASGFRTEILANGFPLVADEPVQVGGTNQGPTPYDLVAAGLGACTAMTLRMYADHKQWPLDGVTVRLKHAKVHAEDSDEERGGSQKIDRIDRVLALEGALDDEQRARLIEIANRCPVHRTLKSGRVEVVTTLEATSAPVASGRD